MFPLCQRRLWSYDLCKSYKNPKGQSRMDNAETLATLGTQDTGQRQTKQKTRKTKKMSNTDHTKNNGWTQVLAKVEQRRAARFVGGVFYDRTPGCVTAMINQLKWEPLEYRRLTSRLVMFYKITHDLIDINAPSYLLPGDARTRGANIYRQPTNDKDNYKFSFFPRTTTDWNRLPETTTSANTIESFHMQPSSCQAAYFTH